MDKDLFYSLEIINKVFKFFFPSSQWTGKLVPKKLVDNALSNPHTHTHVGSMFSHGLDAVYTALHNADKQQTLITVWGSDVQIEENTLWTHVERKCHQFAQDYGFEFSCVKSNFKSFFKTRKLEKLAPDVFHWWSSSMQGLGYTGLTAPILVTQNCTHLFMGASHTQRFPYPRGSHPLIENNIAFAGIGVTHHGPIQRNKKINFIKNYSEIHALEKPFLRVCWGKSPEGGNCTKCEKCLRTIVDLLIQGEAPVDWGFNVTIPQAIETAKDVLPSWKKQHAYSGIQWQCMQNSIKDLYRNNTSRLLSMPPHLTDFFTWLLEYDFTKLTQTRLSQRDIERKEYFVYLWEKSISGTLTSQDLVVLQE